MLGAGPAGLEYARVAAARGHDVVVLEREEEVGGHVRRHALLPGRKEYGQIARWLARQAKATAPTSAPGVEVDEEASTTRSRPSAPTTSSSPPARATARDGWQGQTAAPLPGWETGNCVTWDEVVTGAVAPTGSVLVLDDLQDATAPLTAVKLARGRLHRAARHALADDRDGDDPRGLLPLGPPSSLHRSRRRDRPRPLRQGDRGHAVELLNVYAPGPRRRRVEADWIVMATGRPIGERPLPRAARARARASRRSATRSPRATYEAVTRATARRGSSERHCGPFSPQPLPVGKRSPLDPSRIGLCFVLDSRSRL